MSTHLHHFSPQTLLETLPALGRLDIRAKYTKPTEHLWGLRDCRDSSENGSFTSRLWFKPAWERWGGVWVVNGMSVELCGYAAGVKWDTALRVRSVSDPKTVHAFEGGRVWMEWSHAQALWAACRERWLEYSTDSGRFWLMWPNKWEQI
jgi:hypothetical protein